MEAVTRWLCSFVAEKVRIERLYTRRVTCGENVLLCSITLTDPKSKFRDYHENKISVLYRISQRPIPNCEISIEEANPRQLNVYCNARRAGRATLRLDLGKWYLFKEQDRDISIDIVPSSPKYLTSVTVSCCQKPVDEEHRAEIGTLYYDTKSLLTFEVADKFGNIIEQLQEEQEYDITVEPYAFWNPLRWGMRGGKIFAIFCPKMIGENQMVVRLINKRLNSQEGSTCTYRMSVDILYPSCSPTLTLKLFDGRHDHRCTAGKEFTFDVQLYDVFGKPVLQDSKEKCNIAVQAPHPEKQAHDEMINIRKINNASENVSFAVKAHLKVAGSRKLKLIANCGLKSSSKDIYVEVLPSSPDHLEDVGFTTHGAIDEQFAADPTVMYREQWSILKANIVDYYENDVQVQSEDYNVSFNLYGDKREKTGMTHKDVEIRNGNLRVKMKINEAGKHDMLITLTNRNNPDQVFRFKKSQVQVDEAPFYLAGSQFHFPHTCVAGKEFQLEIIPLDVFGCPLPVHLSTTDCNLRGVISSLEANSDKETIDFKIIKNKSNILFCFSIVLTKAGSRKIMILYKHKSKEFKRYIHVDIVPSSPRCLVNVEVGCCQKPMDNEYKPETGKLYYGTKSLLTFEVADEFGNIIEQIEDEQYYDVKVEPYVFWNPLKWGMSSGKIFAFFCPKMIGENQMVIRLINKRLNSQEEPTCTSRMRVDILCPPCSPTLTLKLFHDRHDHRCMAGKEFTFDVQLYDVFGKPVLQDSKEKCNIVVQLPHPKTEMKQRGKAHDEMVNIRKINTSENVSFAVKAHFEIAGLRQVKLIANSGLKSCSKNMYIEVLPSSPDHLKDVAFTTHGAVDKNFAADPTVMYKEQWSILEASIVDYYENGVHGQSQDYNVSFNLSSDTREKIEISHKDLEIRNGNLRVKMKINEAGKHDLLITLTNRNNPDQVFRLKKSQVQVDEAPFYLAGSEFHFPQSCIAGKEFQLEIVPLDVFGHPLPVNSITDCNLRGTITSLKANSDKETIDFRRVKNESNILICFSIVLTKAGSRKLTIFDKDDDSKELWIKVNPDLNDVHWELTGFTETVYRRENLILALRLFDGFNNEVRSHSSESIPVLREQAGPAGGLHCTGTSTQDNTVTIQCHFKKTGKYDLHLADRGGKSLDGTSFSVIVQDAPIDTRRSSVTWLPQYDDLSDQPVFPEDESFRCRLKLKDVVGCNYEAKISKDFIKVKYGKTEVKDITLSSSGNEIGSYDIVVPLTNLVTNDPNPKFWCFVKGVKIEKPLLLPTFEGFQGYHDEDCFVLLAERWIVCRHVTEKDIKGEDYSHLNNIRRVCELYDDPEIIDTKEIINNRDDDDSICTILKLPLEEIEYVTMQYPKIRRTPEEIKCKIQNFQRILLHVLRATYYREKAFKTDKAREDWKNRASENYQKSKAGGNKELPRVCSQIKEKYARLMGRYHDAACEEFFKFFNTGRGQSEIDLHGLLVVDEKKLQDYKRQLRAKGRLTDVEVESKIAEERDHGNEALRKLRERLHNYDMKQAQEDEEPWLEIIVGSGHHSKVRQQIRPKVEDYLKKRKIKFSPVNKGALVVTFKQYAGKEPCYGEYYCKKCDNRWRNGRSWIGKWQACYNCYEVDELLEKCYPLKQRKRRKTQCYIPYNPRIVSGSRKPPHLEELCQKCIELGELCPLSLV